MSYIRFGSSPDNLYIFGNGTTIEWWRPGPETFHVPNETFYGLCEKYVREGEETTEYGGASIIEEFRDGRFRTVFSYEDNEVEMWDVTWAYIIDRFRYDYWKELDEGRVEALEEENESLRRALSETEIDVETTHE